MKSTFNSAGRLSVSLFCSAMLLAACGGGSGNPSTDSNILAVTGASVSFGTEERLPISISVTQNAEGAPAFDQDIGQPVGPVHQFGPIGLTSPGMVINVPYHRHLLSGGASPQLYIAQPGGEWMQIPDATEVDIGGQAMLQAQVPVLGYAVVAQSSGNNDRALVATMSLKRAPSFATAQASLRVQSASPAPAIVSAFNGQTTNAYRVVAPTRIEYQLSATFASNCAPRINIMGAHTAIVSGQPVTSTRTLASRSFALGLTSATFSAPHHLNVEQNGSLTVYAQVSCSAKTTITSLVGGASMHGFIVNIPRTGTQPVITRSPADASASTGGNATFSVQASAAQSYQWQRSLDGVDYQNVVGATRSSHTVAASLAEQGTFWRAAVTNAAGTSLSSPARFNVAGTVAAAQIAQQPQSRSVSEGRNAQFVVVGQGIPAPTIQWQTRMLDPNNTESGWGDIAGATFSTYITAPVSAANNQRQYRAVVRNSQGAITSEAATLTVQSKPAAPIIVEQPLFATVTEGATAEFSVNASGSDLSYQWFKDGVELVGHIGSSISIPTTSADAGTDISIYVRVSNDGGALSSETVVLRVRRVNTGTASGTINASTGGQISVDNGSVVLDVAPNSLASSQTITVKTHSPTLYNVPSDAYPVSQVIEVSPSNVAFSPSASLSVDIPDTLRDGYALAAIEVEPLEGSVSGFVARASIASTSAYSCLSGRAAVGGKAHIPKTQAGKKVLLAEVPSEACTLHTVPLPAALAEFLSQIPSDTYQACATDADFNFAKNAEKAPFLIPFGEGELVNRHVACNVFENKNVEIDVPDVGYDGKPSVRYGGAKADFTVYWSIYGQSGTGSPKKLFIKVVNRVYDYVGDISPKAPKLSKINAQYFLGCSGWGAYNIDCGDPIGITLYPNQTQVFTRNIPISWDAGAGSVVEFLPDVVIRYRSDGKQLGSGKNGDTSFESELSRRIGGLLRCDVGVATTESAGCVFSKAAAVYTLKGSDVQDVIDHIREAYSVTDTNLMPDGKWKLKEGTRATPHPDVVGLRRARHERVQNLNRSAACQGKTSLIETVLPMKKSASCAAGTVKCSCDEFPFASTWNGAYLSNATSAKMINAAQNSLAGSQLGAMFTKQRVLDLVEYPNDNNFDPWSLSNSSADQFWVHVK